MARSFTARDGSPGRSSRVDSWTLVARLGKGGNAEVWWAAGGEFEVALKLLTAVSGHTKDGPLELD
jgi:hypothetical protein